jgi:hypothetical protein
VNTTISYDQNIAGGSNPIDLDGAAGTAQDDLEYSRFQAFLGARVFW